MFETSVVRAQVAPSRGKYTLLTVSLIAHSAVIVGVIAIGIASVSFPTTAPDAFARAPIFASVAIPPPLGNPNAGAPPRQPAQPPQQPRQQTAPPLQQTAPPAIPQDLPPADTPLTGNDTASGPATSGTELGPLGQPWGKEGSVGPLDAPPVANAEPPVENKIYTVGEVKAPVVIRRVEPLYPGVLQRAKLNGKVAVHCVIDKNGRVRNPEIVFASNPAFAESVLRAIKEWRYQPASLKGEAVECYLDLTVDFGIR